MRKIKPKNIQNIAIVKLSALGDIIHAVIVLQFIKKYLPNTKITWFVDDRFSEILSFCKEIDKVVALPLQDKKIKQSLEIIMTERKNTKFDVVIDLQGLIKSAIISLLLGKNRYGFDKKSVKEPLASLFYTHKFNIDYNENIILRNLGLVAWTLDFNFTKDEILAKKPCFSINDFKTNFKPKKQSKKQILIAPFASEKSKIYDKFTDVVQILDDPKNEIFICFSNEDEKNAAQKIAANSDAKLINLRLNELVKFISQCDLIIGNDSGITHIAWAINIASITIFGNRPKNRNTYETSINLTIDTGKIIDAKKINKNDFCIQQIAPVEIANLAKRLLNG